jgi:holo-[acyl-carrier protein] synthase
MISGIGTDLVEVSRIDQKVKGRQGFMELVFSRREIDYCNKQPFPSESFAARFAAKEAFLKSLGTGLEATFDLHQIEVLNHPNGAPYLQISEKIQQMVLQKTDHRTYRLHVSLSHTKSMATATVMIEII